VSLSVAGTDVAGTDVLDRSLAELDPQVAAAIAAELDGQQAEDRLHRIGITVNRNAVPFDPRPPMVSSGLRIGTPALATRGFGDEDFAEVAEIIAAALKPDFDDEVAEGLRQRVTDLAVKHPLYPQLGDANGAN